MQQMAGKGTITATVRGVPSAVMSQVKAIAVENGVIPGPDGSASDAIRFALVQFVTAQAEIGAAELVGEKVAS